MSDGRKLCYGYDKEERITSVVESYTENDVNVTNTTAYTYDELGQLLKETVNGVVVNTMTYDNYGNILTKNGTAYTYGDSVWKDKLTKVGDQTITYDAQGNPTAYLGHTLTWEKGRQLKSFDNIVYTYNVHGIRTSKTVDGVKHTFILDGNKILREVWGRNTLIPMYDNEDSVCGVIHNDVPFYFLKNLQGDVAAVTDKNGAVVARYAYDAWGVCSVASDTSGVNIGEVNPYRYRGYYYDSEIGMYYLQSRYYDAGVGQFVNWDAPENVLMGENSIGFNGFVYCGNRLIDEHDPEGYEWKRISQYRSNVLLTFLSRLRHPYIMKNYLNNKQYAFTKHIFGQKNYPTTKMKYGFFNMSFNGCELIAIYNAAKLLMKNRQLYKIILEYEYNWGQLAGGLFGTNPYTIGAYLSAHNFKYDKYTNFNKMSNRIKIGGVYIVSYWNSKKYIYSGLHTVALEYQGQGKFKTYNWSTYATKEGSCSSFLELINDGRFICGYRVYW